MQKKKTAVPTYLGVAAVWIGSHFGPGFATGAFSVRWYVKFGWVGLVTPLLAMLITGGVMYFMLEYAREHGTPNYRPFARSCYGEKLGGVVAVLYDICFLMTMMCAGVLPSPVRASSCRASSASIIGRRPSSRSSFPPPSASMAPSCWQSPRAI